jgi:hypothetical protein
MSLISLDITFDRAAAFFSLPAAFHWAPIAQIVQSTRLFTKCF